jgi:DNA-binding transcriptional ArsR family regulator
MNKILNKLRVPNVVDFTLKDKIIDNFALFFFDILRNQGNRFVCISRTKRISDCNSYLNYQFKRLISYARAGEFEKFNYLARILLRNSKVYRNYALQFVFPKFGQMNTMKSVKLYNKVKRLCRTESTDLKYKRVWIDKKPGDAGRPLGVPTPEWRVYGHMLTKILEVFLEGKGLLTHNQHGGKSGYGVMTFLKELAKRLHDNKYLIEFDIKGFFDHVSHESMLKLMEGCYLQEHFREILQKEPEAYKLPETEDDIAAKTQEANLEAAARMIKAGFPREWFEINPYKVAIIWSDAPVNPELVRMAKQFGYVNSPFYHYKEGMSLPYQVIIEQSNPDNYNMETQLNKAGVVTMPPRQYSEEDRAKGRDKWKDLHLSNQGVPQGTSFGPLLASTVLGVALREMRALIYMDDGVIMTKCNKIETDIIKLSDRLQEIGCELAEDKTRALGVIDLWQEGIKLLGTRWKLVKRNLFTYNVTSETRRGISKPLIDVDIKSLEKVLRRLYEAGLVSPSKDSVMKRYLNLPRTRDLLTDSLLQLSVKHEIFGTLLARAYSPESNVTEMAREINYGIFKAEAKLARYPFSSIGSRLYRDNIARYINEEGKSCTTKITLQNVSTLSNDIFMAFLNKELPVRSKLIYNFYPKKVRKAVVKRIVSKLGNKL